MKTKPSFIFVLALLLYSLGGSAQMRVHLINVGQGCATLIEFPCAAILVDTGGENDSLFHSSDSLKAYLTDFFNRRDDLHHTLQCVYLTHPHIDHTLGVPVILDSPFVVIRNAVTDGLERGSGRAGQIDLRKRAEDAEDTPNLADDIGFDPVTTDMIGTAGLTDSIIDPVNCTGTNPVIKLLWGTSATNPGWGKTAMEQPNNHSLVLRIEYGASSLLITGDLEEAGQKLLVAKYNGTALLDADVYLVGHHGSKNGTTPELLNKIRPQMALIGVADPARHFQWSAWGFGHPNKGILDLLQATVTASRTPINVQAGLGQHKFVPYTVSKAIYATAWDGNVVLEADSAGHWHKIESNLVPDLVNINTANLLELEELPGISAKKAQAIVDFRNRHGNFTNIDELDNVPGIGPITIKLIRPYIRF